MSTRSRLDERQRRAWADEEDATWARAALAHSFPLLSPLDLTLTMGLRPTPKTSKEKSIPFWLAEIARRLTAGERLTPATAVRRADSHPSVPRLPDYVIGDGNHRLCAALQLKLTEFPVIWMLPPDWSRQQLQSWLRDREMQGFRRWA